jgi:hypothetical protein
MHEKYGDSQHLNQSKGQPMNKVGFGVALGAGIGAALGVSAGNVAAGLAIGVAVGIAVALLMNWFAQRRRS